MLVLKAWIAKAVVLWPCLVAQAVALLWEGFKAVALLKAVSVLKVVAVLKAVVVFPLVLLVMRLA